MTESKKTISTQDVLETEFVAYTLFSLDAPGVKAVQWRALSEADRAIWQGKAKQFMALARKFFTHYGSVPPKKLIPVLREIIMVPAAPAYDLLEGVEEDK